MKPITVGMVQITNSFSESCYFPYTAGVLQAYFQKHCPIHEQYEFLRPVYRRLPAADALAQLQGADIVAFSTSVWNSCLSLEIAKAYKASNPEAFILFGGPQIPNNAESFLRSNPFVDIACHGEGEMVFMKVLEHFATRNWEPVPSVSYIKNGYYYRQPSIARISDLSTIPSPYLAGVFNDLLLDNPTDQLLGLLETNRGCPFSCVYCDWGAATQSTLYRFDLERIKKEIEWFATHRIEFVFCCDANFGILKRDLDIVQHVVAVKHQHGYPQALSVQNTKNATERSYAIHKILSVSGLNKGVNLALQTVDRQTLINVGRQNISLNSFQTLQKKFNLDGIETFTDIILALPGETYESFTNGVDRIIRNGQHHRIQFINLTLLPNAPMNDPAYKEKHGLVTVHTKAINNHGIAHSAQNEIAEYQELVVGTDTMPSSDWRRVRIFSWITSLLYFDKLLQIPFLMLRELADLSYKELIEQFVVPRGGDYPVLSEINQFFGGEAHRIQQGGAEFFHSHDWLDIYWPHDEYIYLKLWVEQKIDQFYEEAQAVVERLLTKNEIPPFLHEAFTFNKLLLKKPFQTEDLIVRTRFDIWGIYHALRTGERFDPGPHPSEYCIDRTSETWPTWQDWFRKVVWYGNKKGAYLYALKDTTDKARRITL